MAAQYAMCEHEEKERSDEGRAARDKDEKADIRERHVAFFALHPVLSAACSGPALRSYPALVPRPYAPVPRRLLNCAPAKATQRNDEFLPPHRPRAR